MSAPATATKTAVRRFAQQIASDPSAAGLIQRPSGASNPAMKRQQIIGHAWHVRQTRALITRNNLPGVAPDQGDESIARPKKTAMTPLQIYSAHVPRYTSYPTAPHFHKGVDRRRIWRVAWHPAPRHAALPLSAHTVLRHAVLVLRLSHHGREQLRAGAGLCGAAGARDRSDRRHAERSPSGQSHPFRRRLSDHAGTGRHAAPQPRCCATPSTSPPARKWRSR